MLPLIRTMDWISDLVEVAVNFCLVAALNLDPWIGWVGDRRGNSEGVL